MRLFVAIELDRGLRRALARAWLEQAALPPLSTSRGVKAIREDSIHLTLRFLGETSDDRIADAIEAVEAAAATARPFAMVVRGLGCFPKPNLGRVFWAGIEPCSPLETIARRVESELRQRRFPPEGRGFSPHITLARAKGAPVRLREAMPEDSPRFGEQEVDSLVVMESRPSPAGSIYVPVARAAIEEGSDEGEAARGTPEFRGLEGDPGGS